jgi:hypothetical protein
MTFAIVILSIVILGAILWLVFNFWIGLLAIPIVLFILLNYVMATDFFGRQRQINKLRQFRNSARARKVALTDDDKRTVI